MCCTTNADQLAADVRDVFRDDSEFGDLRPGHELTRGITMDPAYLSGSLEVHEQASQQWAKRPYCTPLPSPIDITGGLASEDHVAKMRGGQAIASACDIAQAGADDAIGRTGSGAQCAVADATARRLHSAEALRSWPEPIACATQQPDRDGWYMVYRYAWEFRQRRGGHWLGNAPDPDYWMPIPPRP